MKINKIFILIILNLIFIPSIAKANDTLVYIDKNNIDTKYHRLTCNHIFPNGYISITVEDAFNKGYRSCPDCSPAISDAEQKLKDEEYQERLEEAKQMRHSMGIYTSEEQNMTNNTFTSDMRTVYITKTDSKYHAYGCDALKDTPSKTTVETAKEKGYAPCKICDPYGLATQLYGLNDSNDIYNIFIFVAIAIIVVLIIYLIFNEKNYFKKKNSIPTTSLIKEEK